MVSKEQEDYKFKIVLIADWGVGRRSFVQRYLKNTFNDKERNLIAASFQNHVVENNGRKIKLEIWASSGGRERFSAIHPLLLRGSDALLLVFDLTNPKSLDYIQHAKTQIDKAQYVKPIIVLVGTKCDSKERKIEKSKAEEIANFWNIYYTETSSKTGEGIQEVMSHVVNSVQEKYEVGPNANLVDKETSEQSQQSSYWCNLL